MFVVKHHRLGGTMAVSTCEDYEVDTSVRPHRVTTRTKADGMKVFDLQQGEALFVENLYGKTITAIRLRD